MRDDTSGDRYRERREAMVRGLRQTVSDERVLAAFAEVPRERFVPLEYRDEAYADRPLPIGHGQTISQPTMVAVMLQELDLRGNERVLDIGTGSGYQAALLSRLAREVVSVEIIPDLAAGARSVLAELGYENVRVLVAGEELGWPADAPYDAIVVAAASPRVPQSLIDQLSEGGRLVIPVGARNGQDLLIAKKTAEGVQVMRKGACRFVPLIGRGAFSRD
jgi:protein-L-isoaspartate(D-aspartate) O-methyltransferase